MTDTIKVMEDLRTEVAQLRDRITELEAQVIPGKEVPVTLPPLEEPFAALFRASPVAIVITSFMDGRYLDVNEHFARITGYTREEVIGRTSLELRIWANPEDRFRIGQLLSEQSVIRDMELTFRSKTQEIRVVIASIALVNYQNVPCILTMCHDITDRQHAAAERERLLHEAQAAILIRDDFLSVAAHELKTPLTALQLNIEMIQRIAHKDEDPALALERVVRKLEATQYQINRLGYLTKQLLDVTQLREGRLHLQLEILDLSQIVATIVEQFEGQLLDANCSVTLDLMPGQMIEADQSALDHIITNLIGNAVKYGRGQPIELQVVGDTTTVKLVVRDYGIGIAEVDQQRIFERFERAVSHKGFSGLGLGLYVVHQLVSALHGTITVESQIGSGAAFTVTFPRHDP